MAFVVLQPTNSPLLAFSQQTATDKNNTNKYKSLTYANTRNRLHSSIWLFCNIVKHYVRHAELVSASLRVLAVVGFQPTNTMNNIKCTN